MPHRGLSADGFERTLQHNYLAPFLLTTLLLPTLTPSGARVIGTASVANTFSPLRLDDLQWRRRPYLSGWQAYGAASGRFAISTEQGATPLVHLAMADPVGAPSGTCFDGLSPNGRVHRTARDDTTAAELWDRSAQLVAPQPGVAR